MDTKGAELVYYKISLLALKDITTNRPVRRNFVISCNSVLLRHETIMLLPRGQYSDSVKSVLVSHHKASGNRKSDSLDQQTVP